MAQLPEDWLLDAKDRYKTVRKLLDEDSKADPSTEPYKSKYAARDILIELHKSLEKHWETCDTACSNGNSSASLLLALFKYDLGVVAVDTDEVSAGEEYLEGCLKLISNHKDDPKCCLVAICALNQLGILWSGRKEPNKALEYLKEAERIFKSVRIEESNPIYDFSDYFSEGKPSSKNNLKNWEKAHTHTLYYLAQVYEALGENEKAAMYCHRTLKKQFASGEFDAIDWALNAATLSQFFTVRGSFNCGRHLLACASYILDQHRKSIEADSSTPEIKAEKLETLRYRSADIARCWAKYGLLLLSASRDELLVTASKGESVTDNSEEVNNSKRNLHVLIDLPEVTAMESQVPDQIATNFDLARPIFLNAQKWLNEAKEYYTLEDHATDHSQIIQDISKLYKELVFFEPALDRQCKMHKRRIDMLEEILQALNLQYYLQICRQIMFELAETYAEMMDIKLSYLPQNFNPQSAPVKKINTLVDKSIRYYKSFLDTLRDSHKQFPDKFSDDLARPALVAHFCTGRLYSKIITQDKVKQLENLNSTREYYQFVKDYCTKHPDHGKLMSAELEVMSELLKLIPGTMQNILGGTTIY